MPCWFRVSRVALIILVAVVLVTACTSVPEARDVDAAVSRIRRYADSFVGLNLQDARARLPRGRITESQWQSEGQRGRQLVANYPEYELRLLFFEDRVVTTSFQVLSK